ncbi:MAG TPA: hypothetical protein VLJ15_02875 [Gammaproteobacteria bacterium]|nr:hypothetical protein [Gammaproteobacteria bacterium]
MADRTLSDTRWIKKLYYVLFNGFYLDFLLDELGSGRSLVEGSNSSVDSTAEVKEETRESKIRNQVDAFMGEMKAQGVHHFQSIYARYKKTQFIKKNQVIKKNQINMLNQDQFILLSRHPELVKNWLKKNRSRIIQNEPFVFEDRPALFYLALSGDLQGLIHYKYLGFDIQFSSSGYQFIPSAFALSGNVDAIKYCVNELKINIGASHYIEKHNIFQFIVRSGSLSAVQYAIDHLKLDIKSLSKNKVSIQHMAAATGNTDLMWLFKNKYKLPFDVLTPGQLSVQHWAAMSGSKAAILACNEMKLDMDVKCAGQGLQHSAAGSGKRAALETCLELGLDMTAYTEKGWGVQHCAASGGREALLFCRDRGLEMKAETNTTEKNGIQHILSEIGKPEDFALCSELGLDIEKLDGAGSGFELHAGINGNSWALRFFKSSGKNFRINKPATQPGRGAQHAAAQSGDPLTILTTVELGLDLNEVPGVSVGAGSYAVKSQNPAALLLMQLLGVSLNAHDRNAARQSKNPAMNQLAYLMFFYLDYGRQYPDETLLEWNKIILDNRIEHVAAFFLCMSNKKNVGVFLSGFSLDKKERNILKELACQMRAMKDYNLARIYIYLNYTHLNLMMSGQISFPTESTSFLAIMRYASDKVLDKIHELKLKASADNAKQPELNKGPGF